MDSGKYLLLGISVTPLSSHLPPLVSLDKDPLGLDGDGGAGKHLASVVTPPDTLWLLGFEAGLAKFLCLSVALNWLEGGHHIPPPTTGCRTHAQL